MKRIIITVSIIQLLFLSNNYLLGMEPDTVKGFEIINDIKFSKGIGLRDTLPSTTYVIDILHPFSHAPDSGFNWMLCQWSSKYNLKGVTPEIAKFESRVYADSSKKFSIRSLENSTEVTMAHRASKEYSHARRPGEYWPHLLLEQNYNEPYSLSKLKKLNYNIDAKLTYADNKMSHDAYNPNLHTALYVSYLVISNTNTASTGYGECLYFGINFYDFRHKDIPFYASRDAGKNDATGNFIYCPAANDIYKDSISNKEWVEVNKNILPIIKSAFETAQKRGFMKQSLFDDLHIVGFNIGWEMTGGFDAEVIFKNLSLRGE